MAGGGFTIGRVFWVKRKGAAQGAETQNPKKTPRFRPGRLRRFLNISDSGSGARRELLFNRALIKSNVLWQASFARDLHIALYQRTDVFDHLVVGQETILGNPIARDQMLNVGNLIKGMKVGGPSIRLTGLADQFDHEAALTGGGGPNRCCTAGG